jgi:hypothetical protein
MDKKELEELRQKARLRQEKQDKATFAKKKREGYKYWCNPYYDPYNPHRMYFRSIESAKAWMKKMKTIVEIHPL